MHQIPYDIHVIVEARITDLAGSYRASSSWPARFARREVREALGRGLIALGCRLTGPEAAPRGTGQPVRSWS
ncbi:MAG: hypothetical protein H0T49_04055 [Chloroflexia bacterium]|nr:hypothetical protein [Chloroflexia bacterium]